MRWKALAEIYTMHSFAPFSMLNFFSKISENFANFSPNFAKFDKISLDFGHIFSKSKVAKFCRNLPNNGNFAGNQNGFFNGTEKLEQKLEVRTEKIRK